MEIFLHFRGNRIVVMLLWTVFSSIMLQDVHGCNHKTQCELERNRLSPHLTCVELPFGDSNTSCFGQWSSLSNCKCADPNYRISPSGGSQIYWCYGDGNWKPSIYDLKCSAPCQTDAGTLAISSDPSGNETNIILHNDYVLYSCPFGYTGTGTVRVKCLDGKWEPHERFRCLDSCKLPQNYRFVNPLVTEPIPHGTRQTITCTEDFSSSDFIVRECMNGTFSNIPTCSKPCTIPHDLADNITLSHVLQTYPEGFKLTVSCSDGYFLTGNHEITCLAEGNWNPEVFPSCNLSSCNRPYWNDDRLILSSDTLDYKNGTEIAFSCPGGYTLLGSTSSTCIHSVWQLMNEPACKASSCDDPSPTNTSVDVTPDNSEYEHNETVTFSCPHGYDLKGNSSALCQFGVWEIEYDPKCEPSPCEFPTRGDDEVMITPNKTKYQHNEKITFSCPSGFDLLGDSDAICDFGVWNLIKNPTCEPSLCRSFSPHDKQVKSSPSRKDYQHGDTVSFVCPSGYDVIGNLSAMCQFGIWNIVINPRCEPSPCSYPYLEDPRVNITPNISVFPHTEKVSFSCPDGFILKGVSQAFCRFGSWMILSDPTCEPSPCGEPNLNDVSVVIAPNKTNYDHNDTVAFSCPSGYDLTGDSNAQCQTGLWIIVTEPTCIPSTCETPILTDGLMSFRPNRTQYQHGTELTFLCPPGYLVQGDSTTVCVNGQWDPVNYPACASTSCGTPLLNRISVMITPNLTKYENGTVVTFSCNEDRYLAGDPSARCQEGKWIFTEEPACRGCNATTQCLYPQVLDRMISCLGIRNGPTDPPCFGTWTRFYNCICGDTTKANYRLSSAGGSYYCNPGGKWSPEFYELKCFAPCYVEVGINVISKNSAGQETFFILDGDYVSYSCPINFTATGTSQVACQDGVWGHHQPYSCLAPCEVLAGSNVTAKNSKGHIASVILHGEYVTYSCPENLIAVGTSKVTCNNGSWDDHQYFDCVESFPTTQSTSISNNISTFPDITSAFIKAVGSTLTSEAMHMSSVSESMTANKVQTTGLRTTSQLFHSSRSSAARTLPVSYTHAEMSSSDIEGETLSTSLTSTTQSKDALSTFLPVSTVRSLPLESESFTTSLKDPSSSSPFVSTVDKMKETSVLPHWTTIKDTRSTKDFTTDYLSPMITTMRTTMLLPTSIKHTSSMPRESTVANVPVKTSSMDTFPQIEETSTGSGFRQTSMLSSTHMKQTSKLHQGSTVTDMPLEASVGFYFPHTKETSTGNDNQRTAKFSPTTMEQTSHLSQESIVTDIWGVASTFTGNGNKQTTLLLPTTVKQISDIHHESAVTDVHMKTSQMDTSPQTEETSSGNDYKRTAMLSPITIKQTSNLLQETTVRDKTMGTTTLPLTTMNLTPNAHQESTVKDVPMETSPMDTFSKTDESATENDFRPSAMLSTTTIKQTSSVPQATAVTDVAIGTSSMVTFPKTQKNFTSNANKPNTMLPLTTMNRTPNAHQESTVTDVLMETSPMDTFPQTDESATRNDFRPTAMLSTTTFKQTSSVPQATAVTDVPIGTSSMVTFPKTQKNFTSNANKPTTMLPQTTMKQTSNFDLGSTETDVPLETSSIVTFPKNEDTSTGYDYMQTTVLSLNKMEQTSEFPQISTVTYAPNRTAKDSVTKVTSSVQVSDDASDFSPTDIVTSKKSTHKTVSASSPILKTSKLSLSSEYYMTYAHVETSTNLASKPSPFFTNDGKTTATSSTTKVTNKPTTSQLSSTFETSYAERESTIISTSETLTKLLTNGQNIQTSTETNNPPLTSEKRTPLSTLPSSGTTKYVKSADESSSLSFVSATSFPNDNDSSSLTAFTSSPTQSTHYTVTPNGDQMSRATDSVPTLHVSTDEIKSERTLTPKTGLLPSTASSHTQLANEDMSTPPKATDAHPVNTAVTDKAETMSLSLNISRTGSIPSSNTEIGLSTTQTTPSAVPLLTFNGVTTNTPQMTLLPKSSTLPAALHTETDQKLTTISQTTEDQSSTFRGETARRNDYCDRPTTLEDVEISPDWTTFPIGSTITFSCANQSLVLASVANTAICEGNLRWSLGSVPACVLCSSDAQCSGKANNICDRGSNLCTCQPGTELHGDLCIVKVKIETILILDGTFTEEYNDSNSKEFKNFEEEICEAFKEVFESSTNPFTASGFLECSIISFTAGSIRAVLLTAYDEEKGVTAKLVDTVLNATAWAQESNYSLPGVRYNFTSAPASKVITLNSCEDGRDVCDPVYGVCHSLGGSNYTCSCKNSYDKYPSNESTFPGVSCFVTTVPNLFAITFLSFFSGIVLFLCIAFVFLVIHPWITRGKLNVNNTSLVKKMDNKMNDVENVNINRGMLTEAKLPEDKGLINDTAFIRSEPDTLYPFTKDPNLEEKEKAIARTIQNMGGIPLIPRVSRVDVY